MNYAFFVLLVGILSSTLLAADWNTGTGGNSLRNSLTTEFGPEANDVLWEGGLPSQFAQPAVIEGNIAVMSRTFNIADPLHGTLIVAHDLMTGDTLWTTELPVTLPDTDWRSRVCAIRDGVVYATRSGNTNFAPIYALNAQTGAELWRSDDAVDESSTESPVFAENGDLIIGGFTFLLRINHTNGDRVWRTTRTSPTSGGSEAVVFDNHVYLWEASPQGPKVTAFNLESGARLYSSVALGAGFIQQVSLFVGSDGTVYAPRSQNNESTDYLIALDDDGASLVERWRSPLGFVPFASFGEGPDGSIYSYTRDHRVLRINSGSGAGIDTSAVFSSDFYQPRIAVDAHGTIFLTNGGFSQGMLLSFNQDLTLRWSLDVPNINIGAPAIGNGGTMIICGIGTNVIAFRGTSPNAVDDEVVSNVTTPMLNQNYPNPFNASTMISFELEHAAHVNLTVYNTLGMQVATLVDRVLGEGNQTVNFDASGLASGNYYCRLLIDGRTETKSMILLK